MVLLEFIGVFLGGAVFVMAIAVVILGAMQRCPKCGSKDFIEVDRANGVPWLHCTNCGHEF